MLVLANRASCSLELVSIAPGPPDAEEDERENRQGGRPPRPSTPRLQRRMSRTVIVLALRHALACKGYSVRAGVASWAPPLS